jgi:hypothetical protein
MADEVAERESNNVPPEDSAIRFALLSYAAGVVSNRYVAQLRAKKEAEQPAPAKKSKKEKKVSDTGKPLCEDCGRYFNRELSWLKFNERILTEARNPRNPLLERVSFLGIVADKQPDPAMSTKRRSAAARSWR